MYNLCFLHSDTNKDSWVDLYNPSLQQCNDLASCNPLLQDIGNNPVDMANFPPEWQNADWSKGTSNGNR